MIHLKFLDVVDVTEQVQPKLSKYFPTEKIYVQNDVWDVHVFTITEGEGFSVDMMNMGKELKSQEHFTIESIVEKIEDCDIEDCKEFDTLEEAISLIVDWI